MNILRCLLFLLGSCCTGLYSTKLAPKRPHIVFMIADDLGWNDVSFHGSMQIPTPNIDAIAKDGIILNQHYAQPTCSPTRGSLMTGKYPIRIGFQHDVIKHNSPWGLPLKETIIPQYLKSMKYKTHAVGKWHLGFFKEDYLPLKRGFDSFFGYYAGLKDYFTHVSIWKNFSGLDLHENYENVWHYNGTYGTDLFTAKAKKIIQEHNSSEPLFLYFAQQAPHSGNFAGPTAQAPDTYVKRMIGIEDEKRRIYAGMVSAMDYSVGEIFAALENSGMLDETIFIFTSDNGGAPREKEGTSCSNWPLKGGKYNLWEGGIRVVSFLWSPFLRHRSRIHDGLMHISDWLPTILSAAGGHDALRLLPDIIDGVDQWPSLAHFLPSPRKEILLNINEVKEVEGIRRGRYKLVKGTDYNGKYDKWYDPKGMIYNFTYSTENPQREMLYLRNYLDFLKHSKAAHVLWEKYGKDPRLTLLYTAPDSNALKVKCGVPPPVTPTCNSKKELFLFDVITDPCEFYNIAKELPEVTVELEQAIEQYRAFAIPSGVKPADPQCDPKLHGNAWVPWR